jgi:hypothetical protein
MERWSIGVLQKDLQHIAITPILQHSEINLVRKLLDGLAFFPVIDLENFKYLMC